ncbi:hypothetical protein [Variovorax rhizosphaerae]|uniref:Integron gene cassette protein n=1 Tax=Variovorax rhizosphaerae TaxID=1836200 RepID=A0ABU8WRQ5_9BURK
MHIDKFAELLKIELVHIWGFGIAACVACFLVGCWRRWFGLVLAIMPAVWFVSLLLEIHSADVGPYLYNEQGSAYYVQAYLALALFVAGVVLGALRSRKRPRA